MLQGFPVQEALMAKSGKAPKKKAKKRTAKAGKRTKASKSVKAKAKPKAKLKKVAKAKPKEKAVRKAAPKEAASAPAPKKIKVAKVKSPLTKKQLDHFREKLLDLRDRLLSNVTAMEAEALKASDQDFSVDHMADHGSDNFEQDFTLSLVESERRELVEISQALGRIEGGTYGVCEGTGDVIGMPRLDAIPSTRYSVEYQRRVEAGEIDESAESAESAESEESEEGQEEEG